MLHELRFNSFMKCKNSSGVLISNWVLLTHMLGSALKYEMNCLLTISCKMYTHHEAEILLIISTSKEDSQRLSIRCHNVALFGESQLL